MRPASCSTAQNVAPRGLSTRLRPHGRPSPAGVGGGRPDVLVEKRVEYVEGLQELDCALFEPCLHVARGATRRDRREPVVSEADGIRARVDGQTARAGRWSHGAECPRVVGA